MLQPNFELLWEQIMEKLKSQRLSAEHKARFSLENTATCK